MRWIVTVLVPIAALAASTGASAGAVMRPDWAIGIWANPAETLFIKTGPCRGDGGGDLCGSIVWASQRAMADARDAGVSQLIGTQLLSGYRRTGPGSWNGTVYIPDIGRRFSSRLKQTSAQALTISGCLVGGFLCKSQVWRRVR